MSQLAARAILIIAHLIAWLILPVVSPWARRQERAILRHGSRLSTQQLDDAWRVGVAEPERVRVLFVEKVPPHLPRFLRMLAMRLGLGPGTTAGMALGHGIYIRADQEGRRELVAHELAHIAQYERLGFRPFLHRYLREVLAKGYPEAPLEEEAARIARELPPDDQPSIT